MQFKLHCSGQIIVKIKINFSCIIVCFYNRSTFHLIARLNGRKCMQNRHPYVVVRNHHTNNPYYRFVVFPVNPQAKYAVHKGQLSFVAEGKTIDENFWMSSIEQWIRNQFNIQAIIAKDLNEMLTIGKSRRYTPLQIDGKALIIDIEKSYFDEACVYQQSYVEAPDKAFFPKVNIKLESGCLASQTFIMSSPTVKADFPVFSQVRHTITTSGFWCARSKYVDILPDIQPNPLHINVSGRRKVQMEIRDYGTTDAQHNFGKDIIIAREFPGTSVSYRRRRCELTDWCSNLQPGINKESYLYLTNGITSERGNANKIAKLFADHASKGGKTFSGFIHSHFFRHDATIKKAQEISDELQQIAHREDNNEDVALYLAEKFKSLEAEGFKVNPDGSFARRINYAILQLTNGFCHSVADFDDYLQQKMQQYRTVASPTNRN